MKVNEKKAIVSQEDIMKILDSCQVEDEEALRTLHFEGSETL
ncbi:MAG: hypothetical protein Q4B86_04340 [Eubacteriales bacterium]|nr:hypothetical protein [Eubacteriales bacterium]